jgi:hypothetical protein
MKKFLLILLTSPCFANPSVVPSSTSVFVGGTVQFISVDTVTWSLVAGSTGTISAGGLYTAPTSFQAKNVMDGCPLLPNDHLFNTDISSLPVDSNSATRIANILGGTSGYIQIEVSFPHNVMFNTTPTTTTVSLNTSNNDGTYSMLPFPYTGVENNLLPADYFAQDRHILGVNTDTCQFSEFYNFYPVGKNGGCPTCNTQGNVKYDGMSYNLPDTGGGSGGGVDAAGMFLQPLAFRYSELKAGHIDHALRFTLANGYISSSHIWPAQANANPGCTPSSSCVPYGARFRLKPTFDITPYTATTQVILRALKKYGMFMTDGGTSMHIQSMNDVVDDTTTYQAIQSEIRFNNVVSQWGFDIVDETSLMVSTATGKVLVPNTFNVVPSSYAVVIASKTSDHTTTQVYVALQPVTVGTYNPAFQANGPAISVMAGTPQIQIPTIVNGSATKTVSCSMSPTIGSITSGCGYTAPTSGVRSASTTIVTMTATADSTATINFPLTVFSSDAIRINAGGFSNNITTVAYDSANDYGPDRQGKVWATDPTGIGFMNSIKQDSSFSPSLWVSSNTDPDIGLFYNQWPGIADGAYSAIVPNGNYSLLMGFACGDPGNNSMPSFNQSIDTQGSTIISTAAARSIMENTNYVSVSTTVPITVTNNQFYFAMREVDYSSHTLINKWSLTLNSLILPPSPSQNICGGIKMNGGINLK